MSYLPSMTPVQRRALVIAAALPVLLAAVPAAADDFYVFGRVYSADVFEPAAGATEPPNALRDVPDEQILVDAASVTEDGEAPPLVATEPRDLVLVQVVAAADGTPLGRYITRTDGGWLVAFSAPATPHPDTGRPSIAVRYVVEDILTGERIFSSTEDLIPAWDPSDLAVRYIPIIGDPVPVGGGGATTDMASPGNVTGIFTRVGKIELATGVAGSTVRLIDETDGLATTYRVPGGSKPEIPASVADSLAIPRYQNAPFGGNLFLFGAFSPELYTLAASPNKVYYRIQVTPPIAGGPGWLTDPLYKTRTVVDFDDGTYAATRVQVGPNAGREDPSDPPTPGCIVAGQEVCYRLTPLSEGTNVFWSYPDLLALWRTGSLNGLHMLEIEVQGITGGLGFESFAGVTTLNLQIDNTPVQARIEPLVASDDPATPRVYTPASGPVPRDLQPAALGTLPDDYGGPDSPVCAFLNLQPPPDKHLAFKLTAHHPSGYLRHWYFGHRRNDGGFRVHIGKRYDGSAMDNYQTGLPVESAEVGEDGFTERVLYLSSGDLAPAGGSGPASCGYRFVIHAATRTTDGYRYLRHRWDDDIHCLER
jgi:hypothetical protein